jgi:hypothetical protein
LAKHNRKVKGGKLLNEKIQGQEKQTKRKLHVERQGWYYSLLFFVFVNDLPNKKRSERSSDRTNTYRSTRSRSDATEEGHFDAEIIPKGGSSSMAHYHHRHRHVVAGHSYDEHYSSLLLSTVLEGCLYH